jgi:hypothetical protein
MCSPSPLTTKSKYCPHSSKQVSKYPMKGKVIRVLGMMVYRVLGGKLRSLTTALDGGGWSMSGSCEKERPVSV